MDKLKMQTENIADKNFEVLSKMFPNALTETITGYDDDGKPIVERAIDADVLRQEISCKVVEGKDERYQFTWPDKKKAIMEANMPINKSLRPCIEESVDFSNTENLYIEGDNLEILKLLQETYLEKIKMIYIKAKISSLIICFHRTRNMMIFILNRSFREVRSEECFAAVMRSYRNPACQQLMMKWF